MCGGPMFEVTPSAGVVSAHAVLWVSPQNAKFSVEDADGKPLPFTSTGREGVTEFVINLPQGSEFYVRAIDNKKRFGPWRVGTTTSASVMSKPTIDTKEEVFFTGCPFMQLWKLQSDVSAPMYEFEVISDTKTRTFWSRALWIGESCEANWSWEDQTANVRLRAHFADGSTGPWSNSLSLDPPTPSLVERGAEWLNEVFSL
jgi:hypothetical protein